jgi:hypothetical protein
MERACLVVVTCLLVHPCARMYDGMPGHLPCILPHNHMATGPPFECPLDKTLTTHPPLLATSADAAGQEARPCKHTQASASAHCAAYQQVGTQGGQAGEGGGAEGGRQCLLQTAGQPHITVMNHRLITCLWHVRGCCEALCAALHMWLP